MFWFEHGSRGNFPSYVTRRGRARALRAMEQGGTEELTAGASTAEQAPGKDGAGTAMDGAGTAWMDVVPVPGSAGAAPCRDLLVCCAFGLDRDTFRICKEYLRPFKKSLRRLHLPQHLSRKRKAKYTKESVTTIGDRISLFLQQHCRASEVSHWKKMLWRFVSLFSDKDHRQLQKLYKYIKSNQMDKFQLLCCHLENPDSGHVRKLKKRARRCPAAAGDSAELAGTPSSPALSPLSSESDS